MKHSTSIGCGVGFSEPSGVKRRSPIVIHPWVGGNRLQLRFLVRWVGPGVPRGGVEWRSSCQAGSEVGTLKLDLLQHAGWRVTG